MKNFYFREFYFKSLLLVLLFAIGAPLSGKIQAQNASKAIVVSTGNVVPAEGNALNACYGEGEFKVRILLGSVASTNSAFTITMPTGFEYSGSAMLDGALLTEEATSTSTEVTCGDYGRIVPGLVRDDSDDAAGCEPEL